MPLQKGVDIGSDILNSLLVIFITFLQWLPRILGALIILLVGLWVAQLIRTLFQKMLKAIKLEALADKFRVNELIKSGGISLTLTDMFLWLLYWIVLLVFLSSAANVLGIPTITNFISVLIGYIPAIFAGLVVMLIGIIAANVVSEMLDKVAHGKAFKNVSRWLILLVAFITAVEQLGFNLNFLTENLTIIIAGVMLAFGLAFGLGGKDKAKQFLDKHLK